MTTNHPDPLRRATWDMTRTEFSDLSHGEQIEALLNSLTSSHQRDREILATLYTLETADVIQPPATDAILAVFERHASFKRVDAPEGDA